MHGNVSEWVEDCDFDSYQEHRKTALRPPCNPGLSPQDPRGGSFLYSAKILRSASRDSDPQI